MRNLQKKLNLLEKTAIGTVESANRLQAEIVTRIYAADTSKSNTTEA